MIPFVDGHMDLALNALALRRQITLPLDELRAYEAGGPPGPFDVATVTLPELRAGGAVMVVSTLLARTRPWRLKPGQTGGASGDFPDQDTAHAAAAAQLAYYNCLVDRGWLRLVLTRDDLPSGESLLDADEPLPLLVTFEGSDPVRDPDDLHRWYQAGVRTLMLAHFGKSTYAHGTPAEPEEANDYDVDGPLTPEGRRLLEEMETLGMPLDLSHLSDTSMREAIDVYGGSVYASHCGCRALNADWQRNLPDDFIREIATRGGVIGIPLHSPYLVANFQRDSPRELCGLDEIVDHLDHLCQVTGDDRLVALGTDMDGGYGLNYTPAGVDRIGDIGNIAERMRDRGYGDDVIGRIFSGNWLRYFGEQLPAS